MILTCFAVPQEAEFFTLGEKLPGVEILITGMGEKNAGRAVESALAKCCPTFVLTCGFAGGLNPEFRVGTVVYEAEREPALVEVLAKAGAVAGSFCTSARVASTRGLKRALRERTGADAVDMESRIIRRICAQHGVRSATVRVISDSAEQDLPLDFNTLLTANLEISYLQLARALVRAPQRVPALLRFRRETRLAARHLGEALRDLVGQSGVLT